MAGAGSGVAASPTGGAGVPKVSVGSKNLSQSQLTQSKPPQQQQQLTAASKTVAAANTAIVRFTVSPLTSSTSSVTQVTI
jgi:hypothetical protein